MTPQSRQPSTPVRAAHGQPGSTVEKGPKLVTPRHFISPRESGAYTRAGPTSTARPQAW
jgi:hypothetical protein